MAQSVRGLSAFSSAALRCARRSAAGIALRDLHADPWPEAPRACRRILELVDAHALTRDLDAYSWEIGQGETVSVGMINLRTFTREQVLIAGHRHHSDGSVPGLGVALSRSVGI